MNMPREQGLEVAVVEGRLVISVGVETLAWAWDKRDSDDEIDATVCAPDEFARDVKYALLKEEEDGSNPVHRLLDAAMQYAVEQGSLGVSCPEDDV
jgi:hypothetical protein